MEVVVSIIVLFFVIKCVQIAIEERKRAAAIKAEKEAQEEMNRKKALRNKREIEMAQEYLENDLLETILLYICDGCISAMEILRTSPIA